jgi:hypothetical protein
VPVPVIGPLLLIMALPKAPDSRGCRIFEGYGVFALRWNNWIIEGAGPDYSIPSSQILSDHALPIVRR